MAVKTKEQLKALWVTGYRPTQQDYADLFDSYLNIVDNPTPGWIKKTVVLTQAEVRTLLTANGGYGYKLFDAAGVNKIIQLSNILLKFNHTGGTYPQNYFEIYSANNEDYAPIANMDNSDADVTSANEVFILNSRKSPLFLDYSETSQLINDAIWMYANSDFANYEGTATLIFDYREIDFS